MLSLVQVAGMLFGIVISLLAESIGLRRSMLVGLAISGLASIAGGIAHNVIELLWLRALEGSGFLLTVIAGPGLVRRLVLPRQLSLRLGMWGSYMPIGMALAFLVSPWVISSTSWSVLWWLTGILSLVMAVWLARAVPADSVRTSVRADALQILIMTLTHRGPWLVALCFAMYSFQWLAVIGFLPTIYIQNGYDGHLAGALVAFATLANMIGNVMSGRLLHRGIAPQSLLYTGFIAMLFGAILIFSLPAASSSAQYCGVLLFSILGGLVPGTLFSLAVKAAPNEHSVSSTVGLMQQLLSVGLFSGPPIVAWVASQASGWHLTWLITGMCAIAGCIISSMLIMVLHRSLNDR